MKKHKKIKYTREPIKKIRIVPDFLPSPDKLVMQEETTKITLSLTKESLAFFKQEAQARHTQYQKMIRNLLDQYAAYHRSKKRTFTK